MSDAAYFADDAGVRCRALDARISRAPCWSRTPAAWATFHVFRPLEGMRRLYYFKSGEPRATDGAELERQLRMADWLPAEQFRAPNLDRS